MIAPVRVGGRNLKCANLRTLFRKRNERAIQSAPQKTTAVKLLFDLSETGSLAHICAYMSFFVCLTLPCLYMPFVQLVRFALVARTCAPDFVNETGALSRPFHKK